MTAGDKSPTLFGGWGGDDSESGDDDDRRRRRLASWAIVGIVGVGIIATIAWLWIIAATPTVVVPLGSTGGTVENVEYVQAESTGYIDTVVVELRSDSDTRSVYLIDSEGFVVDRSLDVPVVATHVRLSGELSPGQYRVVTTTDRKVTGTYEFAIGKDLPDWLPFADEADIDTYSRSMPTFHIYYDLDDRTDPFPRMGVFGLRTPGVNSR